MLTLYRPRKSEDSQESDKEKVIPANAPYLTKVNGKLALARQKTPKAADIAIDLLGEAFGGRATVPRKRSKSLERPKTPLLIAGSPYVPQPQLTYSAPIPQQAFPQLSPTIPMLQYQYPYPNPQLYSPNMLPMSQYPTQYPPRCPQPEPQRYTVPPSKPTEKDFEQLKHIDAHYNEINTEKPKRISAGSASGKTTQENPMIKINKTVPEDSATKTTITITKHVCANCGRLRSRKYHHEHLIKVGDTPDPAFCRKCQKDVSSTNASDDDKGPKNKREKAAKDKCSSENKQLQSANAPVLKEPKSMKKEKAVKSFEEYIIVEKEPVQDARRSYTRLRIEEPDVGRRPLSPETMPTQSAGEDERSESSLPKKHFYEPKKRDRRPTFNSYEERLYKHGPLAQASDINRVPIPELEMGHRENSFDTVSSLQSSESRRRRRVERAHPDIAPAAPWNAPHVVHPRSGDEKIVVTERFVYRPKKQVEEQRRQQEYDDRAYYASQDDGAYAEEEASRYYHENWSRGEPVHVREEPPRRGPDQGRYRRDELLDSEVVDSESSEYFRAENAVFYDIPPRAPTPTPVSLTEAWPEIPPSQVSSDDEAAQEVKPARKGKARRRDSPDRPSRCQGRSTSSSTSSNYHPPLVREASDGGTEKALIPPPIPSPQRILSYNNDYFYITGRERVGKEHALVVSPKKSRQRAPSYNDDAFSGMTERERMAERETKRVTFRSPSPSSVSSVRSGYKSDVTESFLRRKTSWDDSDLWKR